MFAKIRSRLRSIRLKHKLTRQARYFNRLIPYLVFEPVKNELEKAPHSISFVVPNMMPFSGGQTSILRLGTGLSNLGLDVRYVCFEDQDATTMTSIAKANLATVQGSFHSKSALQSLASDVWVASVWETAYIIRNLEGYKAYFAQDYEPYFFPYGEKFLLAKQSYDIGLHVITLGAWIKQIIEQHSFASRRLDTVPFPYEKAEYTFAQRDFDSYPTKSTLKVAVYIKEEEKRAPNLIPLLLGQAKAILSKQGISLDVSYFGGDPHMPYPNGKNLGRLTKDRLLTLYHASDLGMVASLTNISLIPYEMLAAGLPIIEFKEGSFSSFFEEGTAILSELNPITLAEQIQAHVQAPATLRSMMSKAQTQLEGLNWDRTAAEFYRHLLNAA